ncbi:MAG: hypothetical protein KBT36_00245 [Kurthia sp.]|nr:hypothetical protein [Candidatus Kurthia equi]
MNKKQHGFAFVELLLVLVITILLGSLALSYGEKGMKNQEINHFFDQLVNDSLLIQKYALNNQTKTAIEFNFKLHTYTAKIVSSDKKLFVRDMPKSMKLNKNSTVNRIAFNENGNASYVGKIIYDYIGGNRALYVYLGSGRVAVK